MFASQLLRILQTIPSDVKHETSVYDSAEQDVTMKDNQNGTLNYDSRSFGREADPLAFQSKEVYQLNGSDECWNSKFVDGLSTDNQNGNNLFEKDNLFTDKIVLECETPESIVCYKDANYHVVRDICVDEGILVNNKISIDSSKDDDDSHCEATGTTDEEQLLSHGLATTIENTKGVGVNLNGSNDEIDGMLLVQCGPELLSESSLDKDFCPEDSMQKDETNIGAIYASKKESFVDNTLPIQEFGTRSFLRSFISSLDGEDNTVKQLPDQSSSEKVVSKGNAPSSEEAGLKEEVQSSSLSYNSKVETGSITFNFKEQSLDSRDVIDHKDTSSENAHDQSLDHSDKNSVNISSNGQLQFAINSINSDGVTVNSHVSKHDENGDLDDDSVGSLRRYDEGETSFSGAGLVTYSGPISFSGNLSLCSEGSATSSRSFAFPILQSEWNSSPARMTKAEGRHFRKHKGWRSGLLCCRF